MSAPGVSTLLFASVTASRSEQSKPEKHEPIAGAAFVSVVLVTTSVSACTGPANASAAMPAAVKSAILRTSRPYIA